MWGYKTLCLSTLSLMTFVWVSQFLKNESASSFQPGGGPSRDLREPPFEALPGTAPHTNLSLFAQYSGLVTVQYGHSRHSRHCIVCRFLPISPLCPCPVSGRCWCWLLVTSGHVTINPTRAVPAWVPAWVPDLEWVRGATWVVSGVMTIETFTSTSCHLNIG